MASFTPTMKVLAPALSRMPMTRTIVTATAMRIAGRSIKLPVLTRRPTEGS
jgi:hypothetical protein